MIHFALCLAIKHYIFHLLLQRGQGPHTGAIRGACAAHWAVLMGVVINIKPCSVGCQMCIICRRHCIHSITDACQIPYHAVLDSHLRIWHDFQFIIIKGKLEWIKCRKKNSSIWASELYMRGKFEDYLQKQIECIVHTCIHWSYVVTNNGKARELKGVAKTWLTDTDFLRITKVVCQRLDFICCKIVLIPKNMVVRRTTSPLQMWMMPQDQHGNKWANNHLNW